MSPHALREIVELAHRQGIYVISDECYVYLNYATEPFSLGSITKAKEHLVIIGSLSKTYAMTGWRMGYALATEPLYQGEAIAAVAASDERTAAKAIEKLKVD